MAMDCKSPLIVLILLVFSPSVRSDDQNCMNKATKVIKVDVTGDNPNKVLTYVRDDPGYTKGLECKWIMHASDYSKPRQMLLNVKVVDFDTNSSNNTDCKNPNLDMFNFTISGTSIPKSQVQSQKWCSEQSVPSRLMLANLWNSSNYLTVEFRSDNVENRSNAKGVQMDVLIMSRDYCHSSMLFHNGSCYLITEQLLTFEESLRTSGFVLGNVAAFADEQSVQRFLKSNVDRQDSFPYRPALDLGAGKVWTGNFMDSGDRPSNLTRLMVSGGDNCRAAEASVSVVQCNCTAERCGLALQLVAGQLVFTCEPMTQQLPALIGFSQIPEAKADLQPRLFASCDRLPPVPTPTPPPTSTPTPGFTPVPHPSGCPEGCFIGIVVAVCIFCLVATIIILVVVKRRRRQRPKNGDEGERQSFPCDSSVVPNVAAGVKPVCRCPGKCTCDAAVAGKSRLVATEKAEA